MVKKKEKDNSGTGYEGGQYPFVHYNQAVLQYNKRQNYSLSSSHSITMAS